MEQTPRENPDPGSPEGKAAGNGRVDEAGLLRRLRDGDGEAFEDLVRAYGGRLLATTRRFLGSEDDAQDAVQDAFLSAYRSLHQFAGGARLSTWLHRIAVNAALMKLRTRRRKPEDPIEDLLPRFDENGVITQPAGEWKAPAQRLLERKEDRRFVRNCIAQLPESYRTVLVLRDIEELDTRETAQILDVTANAVKIRLHRARLALRTLLASRFSKESA